MKRIAELLEVLGGARDLPAPLVRSRALALGTGVYWVVLLLLILAFAGRSAKFIYIDF